MPMAEPSLIREEPTPQPEPPCRGWRRLRSGDSPRSARRNPGRTRSRGARVTSRKAVSHGMRPHRRCLRPSDPHPGPTCRSSWLRTGRLPPGRLFCAQLASLSRLSPSLRILFAGTAVAAVSTLPPSSVALPCPGGAGNRRGVGPTRSRRRIALRLGRDCRNDAEATIRSRRRRPSRSTRGQLGPSDEVDDRQAEFGLDA